MIERAAFYNAMMELVHSYERREPSPDTWRLWYAELKHIPEDRLRSIVRRIIRYEEWWPKNMVNVILRYYNEKPKERQEEKLPQETEEDRRIAKDMFRKLQMELSPQPTEDERERMELLKRQAEEMR